MMTGRRSSGANADWTLLCLRMGDVGSLLGQRLRLAEQSLLTLQTHYSCWSETKDCVSLDGSSFYPLSRKRGHPALPSVPMRLRGAIREIAAPRKT